MTRTTAVRLGIPASSLARRILIPAGVVLLLLVAIASLWQADRVRQKRAFEQRSAVRTVFETSPAVLNGSGGLGTLARNRGFDRIWVLSATGDILDSNQPQEIGHPLDARWWGRVCIRRNRRSSGLRPEGPDKSNYSFTRLG